MQPNCKRMNEQQYYHDLIHSQFHGFPLVMLINKSYIIRSIECVVRFIAVEENIEHRTYVTNYT